MALIRDFIDDNLFMDNDLTSPYNYKDSIITERIKRVEIAVIDPIDISQSTTVIAKEIII